MASGREVAADLTHRVEEEFRRSGALPSELLREIQASAAKRGHFPTLAEVEKFTRAWIERNLATRARKPQRAKHADDKVERAIEHLSTSSPAADPVAWSDAVIVIEDAWVAGTVTKAQQRKLDLLEGLWAARIGA